MLMRKICKSVLMAGAMLSPVMLQAQTPAANHPPSMTGKAESADVPTLPMDQILTSTVHEAWIASGRDEDKFFAMVKQLAELSAQKRGIVLPETEEAGAKAGAWIKKEARRDPNQLLYVVVDRAVQHVGKMQGGATAAASAPAPATN